MDGGGICWMHPTKYRSIVRNFVDIRKGAYVKMQGDIY